MTSIYNAQFYGNILVVGRTGCGKTTFLEKLGLNKFFGDIIKTEWISGIDIDKTRKIELNYISVTRSREESNDNHDNVINFFGENKTLN